MIADSKSMLKGASFLLEEQAEGTGFFPEDFTEEHHMIVETVEQFIKNRIWPQVDDIEAMKEGVTPKLMEEFGALGLFGTHMPEKYGGMDLDFISNYLIGETIGYAGSFSVSYNAHTGIGMLPILYYGTDAQKEKYLPKLITAEYKASYCLTEPSSGSDALSAKARAELSDDGQHYILNGQKMWITNAGFADVFVVFAQFEGDKFSCFLVDRETPGLSLGAEEKKLGIKGSSTRMVFLENVKIPTTNLLGEIGKGHLIAFNVLNIGRFKLGISCLGGSKKVCEVSVKYANERKQFKTAIANFGAIKHKIAQQVILNFTTESASCRLADCIQQEVDRQKSLGKGYAESKLIAAEEYAIECSILKLLGSETLDYCVDENVQIHGGMGFSEEGTAARAYRDSRINRIFEGTNEINRLLMVSQLFKRVMKGEFDLATPAMAVQQELMNNSLNGYNEAFKFADERLALKNFKKLFLMLMGYLGQQVMSKNIDLKAEQEVVMNISDIMTDIYTIESTLLRVEKIHATNSKENKEVYDAILKTFIHDANFNIQKRAYDVCAATVEGDMQNGFVSGIRKLTKYPLQNTKELRRTVADHLIAANTYNL